MVKNRPNLVLKRYILIITAILLLTQIIRIYNFWVNLVTGQEFSFNVLVSGKNDKCQFKLNNWSFLIENCHKYQTGSELKLIGRLTIDSDKQLLKTKKLNIQVISVNKNPITSVLSWISGFISQIGVLRDKVIDRLMGYMPNAPFALLIDMPFGQIIDLPEPVYHQLKTIGMLHVVAASGYNVSLVAGVVGGIAARFRRPQSVAVWWLGMFAYLFLSDLSISILRAFVMFILKKLAQSAGRIYHNFILLTTAVFLFLLFKPWLIFNLSFQLSVGAVVGLILFAEKINQFLLRSFALINIKNKFVSVFIVEPLGTAFAAQLVTTPILLWHFGEVTAFSFVANLLLLWMTPFLTVSGMMLFALGSVSFFVPWLEKIVSIYSLYAWFYAEIFIKSADALAKSFLFKIQIKTHHSTIFVLFLLIFLFTFVKSKKYGQKSFFNFSNLGIK